jgi:hypothetical protein
MGEKLLRMRWLPMSVGAMVLTAAALLGSAYGAAASTAHRGILLPRHPARSMAPGTSLLSSCSAGDTGGACNQMVLTAIGTARQTLEKMGGMSLSLPAYAKLTPSQQLFVVVNLERTERAARDPAMNRVPRHLPGGGRTVYASANWAGGWVNPPGADYAWMYDDGPGGNNLDCRAGTSRLCWGHRDNILNRFGQSSCVLAMGAGHAAAARGYRESDTVLMAGVCGHAPTDPSFTWAKAKKLLHVR